MGGKIGGKERQKGTGKMSRQRKERKGGSFLIPQQLKDM